MTAIVVFVHDIATADESDDILYRCKMRSEGMNALNGDIVFDTQVASRASSAVINAAIKSAALAATAGWPFQDADQVVLFGGAVGL